MIHHTTVSFYFYSFIFSAYILFWNDDVVVVVALFLLLLFLLQYISRCAYIARARLYRMFDCRSTHAFPLSHACLIRLRPFYIYTLYVYIGRVCVCMFCMCWFCSCLHFVWCLFHVPYETHDNICVCISKHSVKSYRWTKRPHTHTYITHKHVRVCVRACLCTYECACQTVNEYISRFSRT